MSDLKHIDVTAGKITEAQYEGLDQHELSGGTQGDLIYWDAANGKFKGIAHKDVLDAHTYNPLQKVRTGEYFTTVTLLDPPATVASYADRFQVLPLIVARAMTLDAIAVEIIGAAGGGDNARLGIYNDGTNVHPGTLVVDGGEIDCSAIGIKAVSIDESLTKGLYWVVILPEANITIKGAKAYIPQLGFEVADFDDPQVFWYGTRAYGALPDPYAATVESISAITVPLILVKASSLD